MILIPDLLEFMNLRFHSIHPIFNEIADGTNEASRNILSLLTANVRDGLGLGLGLGKQRRASWTGQELENEDVDDNVVLIARELEKGLREISTGRERKCLWLVTESLI